MDSIMEFYVQGIVEIYEKEKKRTKQKEEQRKKKEEQEKTLWLAYHDGLTSVYNRMGFSQRCEEQGYEKPDFDITKLIMLAFDINDLKIANDQYGHDVGDALICHVAKELVACMETQDVFRMGGDEFLVILCEVTDEELECRLETFQKRVRNNNTFIPFPVTVSCGVVRGQKSLSISDLQHMADQHMYAEKRKIKECAKKEQNKTQNTLMKTSAVLEKESMWEAVGKNYLFIFAIIVILVL